MEYTDAMQVLGALYGEWPELKEKSSDEEVRIALRAHVEAYLEQSKAYEAFASEIDNRSLKEAFEKATEEMNLTQDELMNLIEVTN